MAVGIVVDPFDDDVGSLIPNARAFYIESDDIMLFDNLVAAFARFYHYISGGNTANEDFGILSLLWL